MSIRKQESFNFYSHLAGAIAAIVGTVFLVLVARYSASALLPLLSMEFPLFFFF